MDYIPSILCGILAVWLGGAIILESHTKKVVTEIISDYEVCMVFNEPDALCAVTVGTDEPGVHQVVGSKLCSTAKATREEAQKYCINYALGQPR